MIAWLMILMPSAAVGFICGLVSKRRIGVVLAGLVPWLGLMGVILYNEYFVPYQGGGASMWVIAQLFSGTIAAGVGVGAYYMCRIYVKKDK